ncbi:MAG: 2-oxoacid:acceptor oxidoreductase subunit alpha [Candidatus Gracilibacteria bacterium]|nr:2-oxoacid:acceptor oxidoreductase subunit alpha [bacterium]MDZ4216789.1 2-oxoacid:acceptor oxidoreductase subunit alpha [Candidatus Gracilibacteria bacterium]
MNRTVLKITGESGMGLASVGSIIAKALKRAGFSIQLDREYPSLIKGGHSNVQIDFSIEALHCLSKEVDIVVALDRVGLLEYLKTLKEGGVLIHGYERHHLMKDLEKQVKKRKLKLVYLSARQIAYSFGGSVLMTNMVLLGALWKVLGLGFKALEEQVKEEYADKPNLLQIDLKCLKAGFESKEPGHQTHFRIPQPKQKPRKLLINGNEALALGAIHCGVRTYYAYPMSPSSSILTDLANWSHESGMIVKQGEDEITVANMALGSMFMGTRALAATSGGGYDLMTETISLAGMTETPFVIVIAQRPGPATGLPTWTAQSDLNLALYSSHGEFARVVIAVSDPTSCFDLIQHAMNLAEEFQIPVVVLTEKVIAESETMIDPPQLKKIPIKRGLVTLPTELKKLQSSDRFKITKDGVSMRWIPGSSPAFYFSNGDEHWEDGVLTEREDQVGIMYDKRIKKLKTITKTIPEPRIFGTKKNANISFIGWGSSKGVLQDIIPLAKSKGISINYLHFDYLWPLKTKTLRQFCTDNPNIHVLEGNHTGQLAQLMEKETDLKFPQRFNKFNGRPFFLEEVLEYIKKEI